MRIFADSDNALGSRRGDIDDGIALAALLKSGLQVEAIASVFGNTSAAAAQRNSAELAARCGFTGPILAGAADPRAPLSEAARRLTDGPAGRTVLALVPLTNVAQALRSDATLSERIAELVCLGSNATSRGRWPPVWPFEYNFTKDRAALVDVFASKTPLTVVPLDQARRLRLRFADLAAVQGVLGEYLRTHARRWFTRAQRLKLQASVPVWDLVASMYLVQPGRFEVRHQTARAHANGWVEYGASGRGVRVIRDFDPSEIWREALALLNRETIVRW